MPQPDPQIGAMKCHDCGSHLEGRVSKSGLVTCAYCGSGYDLRSRPVPAPSLIARADFSTTALTGWLPGRDVHATPSPGAWTITQVHDGQNHPLLIAPGAYEDFEVALTFRFLAAEPEDFVFLRARGAPGGAITLHAWPEGSLALRWQQPDHTWQPYIANVPPGLPITGADWRHIRWSATGPRHRVYLNGALALSTTHHPIVHGGHLDLRIQTHSPSVTIEVSQLELFEPAGT